MNGSHAINLSRTLAREHKRAGVAVVRVRDGLVLTDAEGLAPTPHELAVRKRALSAGGDVRRFMHENRERIDGAFDAAVIWAVYDHDERVSRIGLAMEVA